MWQANAYMAQDRIDSGTYEAKKSFKRIPSKKGKKDISIRIEKYKRKISSNE